MNDFCYYVNPTQDKDEYGGFVPSVVYRDRSGHYPLLGRGEGSTPWIWGDTLEKAEKVCKAMNNDNLNLTDKEVDKIIKSSMFG